MQVERFVSMYTGSKWGGTVVRVEVAKEHFQGKLDKEWAQADKKAEDKAFAKSKKVEARMGQLSTEAKEMVIKAANAGKEGKDGKEKKEKKEGKEGKEGKEKKTLWKERERNPIIKIEGYSVPLKVAEEVVCDDDRYTVPLTAAEAVVSSEGQPASARSTSAASTASKGKGKGGKAGLNSRSKIVFMDGEDGGEPGEATYGGGNEGGHVQMEAWGFFAHTPKVNPTP
ncbi:hypothetical protein T484DRAFT_1808549 [Baffinella frigidus]|nr:hypothetical protein T484DRAFT_1808549 [Cryptophyta sp. CCMP2293]